MATKNSVGSYLLILSVIFVTYLLLGSFVVSKSLLELAYLIILYIFIGIIKFASIKE